MRRVQRLALILPWLLLHGCRGAGEPVAELAVAPAELQLELGSFVDLEVRIMPLVDFAAGAVPRVFLHLVDEPGSVLRTFDHAPPGEFRQGHEIAYKVRIYQSAVSEPLSPGLYTLTAGLHAGAGGRFRLRGPSPEVARLEYAVARVRVPEPSPSAPAVRFSPSWLPGEPGRDRQILSRRPLAGAGPGTFQIGPLQGPGEILLRLGLPAPGSGRVERLSGETSSKIRLRSSCGDFQAEISGDGADGSGIEILIPVPPTAAPVECDVRIEPNFQLRSGDQADRRSVSIEILAWRAAATDDAVADGDE
ncbi:MAG: hypothetical protein ABIV06_09705 [Thermoanaerobaculia bacterium]